MAHPFVVSDDYRAHFFWLGRIGDKQVFERDLLFGYWRNFVPEGLVAIYAGLTRIMPGPLASKLIGLLTVFAFLTGCAVLGRRLFRSGWSRFAFAAWLAGDGSLLRSVVLGGLSRGFGPPLQVWFVACLVADQPWLALLIVLVALFFHPITFALLAAALGLWWLLTCRERRSNEQWRGHLRVGFAALVVVVGGAAGLAQQASATRARFGPPLSLREVHSTAPEWQKGGRQFDERPAGLASDSLRPMLQRSSDPTRAYWLLGLGAIGVALIPPILRLRRNKALLPLAAYGAGAVGCYVIALVLLPRLYAPNRYVEMAVRVLLGVALGLFVGWYGKRLSATQPTGVLFRGLLVLAPLALYAAGLISHPPNGYRTDTAPSAPAARWLRDHVAPYQMFAAFPQDADDLLMLSERPCLVSYECDQALFRSYLAETRLRLRLLFTAYYAFSVEDVRGLAQGTPAEYLVIRRSDLSHGNKQPFFRGYPRPHSWEVRSWLAQHPGMQGFWTRPDSPAPVYSDQRYLIFSLAPYRN